MRSFRLPAPALALLLGLLVAVPVGSAKPLSGSVNALGVYVEGVSDTASPGLIVRLGHKIDSFTNPPLISASAESIQLERDFNERTKLCAGFCTGLDTAGDHSGSTHNNAELRFLSWQASKSEVLVGVGDRFAAGTGRLVDALDRPKPLELTTRYQEIHFASDAERVLGPERPYTVEIPAGTLTYDPATARQIEYTGNFVLWIFGASFQVVGDDGSSVTLETGHRLREAAVPGTYNEWLNVTALTFTNGHLSVDPRGNSVDAFAPTALLSGNGLLHLDHATGLLRSEKRTRQVTDESVELEGSYRLEVASRSLGGVTMYSLGLDGEFESIEYASTSSTVATSGFAWWPLLLIGLAAVAGGAGGLVLLQRRRDRPDDSAALLPRIPQRVRDTLPAPAPVVSLKEVAPGLAWEELSEEFGVVHAGEKAGIFVLLVPEERIQSFVHSVASRGIIAEDTGDRIQAGDHPLAVVTLEPSPVSLN